MPTTISPSGLSQQRKEYLFQEIRELAEQNILEREKQRLDEIDMEAELFKQDGVEISLRRSHNILQEEEVRLGSEVNDNEESGFFREALFQENYEDLMPQLAVGRRPKSDLGYDSVSSPATNRRTTVSGSKTSYEEPDLQEEPQSSIISQAPMTDQSTKLFKAREALGSILPKFSSTVEIDQFCVQLRNKRLNTHKTVADAYTRDTYMLDQPSTSNNEENTTFLDTNNYY